MLILNVTEERSSGATSLRTPSPKTAKGIRLFRVISRKLVRRSQEDDYHLSVVVDQGSRSSSSDSCASSGHVSRIELSPNRSSSSISETGSDTFQNSRRHHHSTSAESLRKAFQNMNLYSRSQSCASTKEVKKRKEKKVQKSILRHPTSYTYVKGLSGLPTQRITGRGYNTCNCSMHYLSSINR